MAEDYGQQLNYDSRFFSDFSTRIRDLEEKMRILRDRVLLTSESFVKDREKSIGEVTELKKTVEIMKNENQRIKDIINKITESIDKSARKEDLMILKRQFDLFRG